MKHIFLPLLFLLALFLVSRYIFEPTYLYYEFLWLDIPMHILGGIGVGLLSYAVLTYKKIKVSFWKIFVIYVAIAIAWETYEYIRGVVEYTSIGKWFDSLQDIAYGALGLGITYFLKRN